MSKKDEIFRRYEKLAKAAKREKLESASGHKPGSCAHCLYYRPDFKYRRCQFTRCPYGKDKELMSRDELAVMDGSKCVLQLRGVRPFLSDKYDLTQHPNYKYTADYDKKLTFDIEKYLSTRAKLYPKDEFFVMEEEN